MRAAVADRLQDRLCEVRQAIAKGEEQLLVALALNREAEIDRLVRFVRELRTWSDLIELAIEGKDGRRE